MMHAATEVLTLSTIPFLQRRSERRNKVYATRSWSLTLEHSYVHPKNVHEMDSQRNLVKLEMYRIWFTGT